MARSRLGAYLSCGHLLPILGLVSQPGSRRGSLPYRPRAHARVADGRDLPRVAVVDPGQGEEEQDSDQEQLVACVKYALGLEGGGVVLQEGREPTVGMRKKVFVELLDMLVHPWGS